MRQLTEWLSLASRHVPESGLSRRNNPVHGLHRWSGSIGIPVDAILAFGGCSVHWRAGSQPHRPIDGDNKVDALLCDSVLADSAVAVRYFFIPTFSWNGDILSEAEAASVPAATLQTPSRARLSDVHEFLSEWDQARHTGPNGHANPLRDYIQPILSFYQDVTIPFTTRRSLPIVALCSPRSQSNQSSLPVEISVRWPITQSWEGRDARIGLDEQEDDAASSDHVSAFPACVTDSVALFDSGHIIYSISFLLQLPRDLLRCNADLGQADRGALSIVALTSLLGSAGASLYDRRGNVRERVRFAMPGKAAVALDEFVQQRLSCLLFEEHDASSSHHTWKPLARRVAGFFRRPHDSTDDRSPRQSGTVFSDVLRPVLARAKWTDPELRHARTELSKIGWRDLAGASIEVIGERSYGCVKARLNAAKQADGRLEASSYTKALAGIAQNVLDLREQDEHEIMDSLIEGFDISDHTYFVNPRCTVRFSKSSRAFEALRNDLGGCPYFYLTNLIMVYREFILDQIALLVDAMGLSLRHSAAMTGAGDAKSRSISGLERIFELPEHLRRTRERLKLREQLFLNRSLRDIPNVFRYPSEKAMFERITELHGFDRRLDGFEKFLKDYDSIASERAALSRETTAESSNRFLLTIGLLQVLGVALTAQDMKSKLEITDWLVIGVLFLAALVPALLALALRRRR